MSLNVNHPRRGYYMGFEGMCRRWGKREDVQTEANMVALKGS